MSFQYLWYFNTWQSATAGGSAGTQGKVKVHKIRIDAGTEFFAETNPGI